jgi:DNA (cytosine-5)-methyltransferase 1
VEYLLQVQWYMLITGLQVSDVAVLVGGNEFRIYIIRVKKCDYIPTLVAMSMIPIYGPKNRKLTPLELLRLQSFNDNFQYNEKHIYKQVGNAVNVTMIEKCARFLLNNEPLF